jgi:hypothetical protein
VLASRSTKSSHRAAANLTKGAAARRAAEPAIRRRCSATSSCARGRGRQAPSTAATADDELALLVVHGVLHLLDYDHAEPRRPRDAAPEQELLARFRELEATRVRSHRSGESA